MVLVFAAAPAHAGPDVPDVDDAKDQVEDKAEDVDKPDVDVPDAPEVQAPEVPAVPEPPDPVPQPPRLPSPPQPDVPSPSASQPGSSGSTAPSSGGASARRGGSGRGGASGGGWTASQSRAWAFGVATSGLVRTPSGSPGASSSRPAVLRYERRLRDTVARLRGCLTGLPGLERRVLTMRANVTAKRTRPRVAVARALRISAGRVASLERRALSRLRSSSAVTGCAGGTGGPFTIATAFLGVSDVGLLGAGTLAAVSDAPNRASTSTSAAAPRSAVAGVQAQYPPALPTVSGTRATSSLGAQILLPALLAMAVIAMVGLILLRQRRAPLTVDGPTNASEQVTRATAATPPAFEPPVAAAPAQAIEPGPEAESPPEPEPQPEPEPPGPEPEPPPEPQLQAQPEAEATSPPPAAEQSSPGQPHHGHRREVGIAAGALTIGALRLLRRLRSQR